MPKIVPKVPKDTSGAFEAKYSKSCYVCGIRYYRGDLVKFCKDGNGVGHVDCVEQE